MSWAILMLGASVMAGDNSPATLEAHLTLVSDYRSRGLSSSREEPAVQGGATIINDTGAYLGGWASSLEPSETPARKSTSSPAMLRTMRALSGMSPSPLTPSRTKTTPPMAS
jgi:uncharacterized protein (TIGR02001 family)